MGLTGADPPQNRAHTMPSAAKKGARGGRGGRGALGAPAAKKRAPEQIFQEIMDSLEGPIPPVRVADGPVPELVRPEHPQAARTWCSCPVCSRVRERVSPGKLLTTPTTLMWRKFHGAWHEGITPEFEALASTQNWKIPGWLREHVPLGIPAPIL